MSRFTIAESSHRILDPFTPAKLDELGNALHLTAGMTMLDLACGKGEALCQWASQHGITGTGVDFNPPFIAAARDRARELGVSEQVILLESNAAGFVAETPVDVASCMGATWIGGGTLGTLDLLALSMKPGGIALIGEVYWREVPTTPEELTGTGSQSVEQFSTLWDLIEQFQSEGWDLVEMVLADEDSWDRYTAAQWLNMRRFIDANPDDEIVPELRAELDAVPGKYVRYRRRYWGWGVFALMKR